MKNKILTTSIVVFLLTCSSSFANKFEMVITSSPQKATIYTDGSCIFEELLSTRFDKNSAIKLPPETLINSIVIYQGTQRIRDISIVPFKTEYSKQDIQKVSGVKIVKESKSSRIIYYLVTINEQINNSEKLPLKLNYTVKGITWKPTINANIINNRKANLCLEATISNKVKKLDDITVSLVATPAKKQLSKNKNRRNRYNQNIPDEEYYPWEKIKHSTSLYSEYKIGVTSIAKGVDNYKLTNVFCLETDLADIIYMWKTKEKIVKKFNYINNPFSLPLCNADFNIFKNNIKVASRKSKWVEPHGSLLLLEQNENNISCSSSVEVIENQEKRSLWRNCSSSSTPPCDTNNALFYNHQFEFTCENNTGSDVVLEVVFEKKYGKNFKNIYNFQKEPAKSPGWWHIWNLNIKNKKKNDIKFNIDSDRKTYKEYKKYSRAIEGC